MRIRYVRPVRAMGLMTVMRQGALAAASQETVRLTLTRDGLSTADTGLIIARHGQDIGRKGTLEFPFANGVIR